MVQGVKETSALMLCGRRGHTGMSCEELMSPLNHDWAKWGGVGGVRGVRQWELGTEIRAHWLSVACWWCVFHVLQARMSGVKPVCLKWVRKTTSDAKQGWVTCTYKYGHAYQSSWQEDSTLLACKRKLAVTEGTGFNPLTFPSQPQTGPVGIRGKAVETNETPPSRFLNTCVLCSTNSTLPCLKGPPPSCTLLQ